MSHISIFPPEDPAGLGLVTLPRSFRLLKRAANAAGTDLTPLLRELRKVLEDKGERRVLGQLRGSAAAEVADCLDIVRKPSLVTNSNCRRPTIL